MILEPLVQGAGGMRMCRPHFLAAVQALLRQCDVLAIYDEVADRVWAHWGALRL